MRDEEQNSQMIPTMAAKIKNPNTKGGFSRMLRIFRV